MIPTLRTVVKYRRAVSVTSFVILTFLAVLVGEPKLAFTLFLSGAVIVMVVLRPDSTSKS